MKDLNNKVDFIFEIIEIKTHLKIVQENLETLEANVFKLKESNPDYIKEFEKFKGELVRLKDTMNSKLNFNLNETSEN